MIHRLFNARSALARILNGASELEYYHPIKAGRPTFLRTGKPGQFGVYITTAAEAVNRAICLRAIFTIPIWKTLCLPGVGFVTFSQPFPKKLANLGSHDKNYGGIVYPES